MDNEFAMIPTLPGYGIQAYVQVINSDNLENKQNALLALHEIAQFQAFTSDNEEGQGFYQRVALLVDQIIKNNSGTMKLTSILMKINFLPTFIYHIGEKRILFSFYKNNLCVVGRREEVDIYSEQTEAEIEYIKHHDNFYISEGITDTPKCGVLKNRICHLSPNQIYLIDRDFLYICKCQGTHIEVKYLNNVLQINREDDLLERLNIRNSSLNVKLSKTENGWEFNITKGQVFLMVHNKLTLTKGKMSYKIAIDSIFCIGDSYYRIFSFK